MTNEWAEFKAYTETPQYTSKSKRDKTYMGRFTLDMICDFEGFSRIFVILARGYLFHDRDGDLLPGDPYERIDHARNALLAWCSVPDRRAKPKVKVDHGELSERFPELVDSDGKGWYYRHVKKVIKFLKDHPESANKEALEKLDGLSARFTNHWKTKVAHFQVPIFARNTKGAWGLRFDDVIADALEDGPLRTEEYALPDEIAEKVEAYLNSRSKRTPTWNKMIPDLVAYYYANKPEDTDWVVLPVVSFNAYYGSTTFEKSVLSAIPESVMVKESMHNVSRYRVVL